MTDAVYSLRTEDAIVVVWSFDDEVRIDIRFKGGPSLLAEVRLDHGEDELPARMSGKWLAIVGMRKDRPVSWRAKECQSFETREEAVASVVARFLPLWREHVQPAATPLEQSDAATPTRSTEITRVTLALAPKQAKPVSPWLAANTNWLDRARSRWAPRAPEPLTVRVWLSSPVAWGEHGVQLDGLLQRLVVERETGLPSDDVFAECPRGLNPEIQIPVADVEIAGLPIACASWGAPPPIAAESLRWRRKRARLDAMAGNRLTIAGGPYKSTNIPVQTLVTPWLDFHLVADRDRVRDLLSEATALGRGYSSGLGTILGIEYLPDPEQRALAWKGQPMRALPLGEGCPELDDPVCMFTSTRAPYWAGKGRRVCAVPVVRLGLAAVATPP